MTSSSGPPSSSGPASQSLDAVGSLQRLDEFTLADLESVRMILRGDSVIDWHRLNLRDLDEARTLLAAQDLRPDDRADRARLDAVKQEAISYLRRAFEFPIPRPLAEATTEEILLVASSEGHRQVAACTILKVMHIIHHLEGRELLFTLPLSDQEVFHLVEEKVYRVVGGMLAAGFPIVEFVGGRKNKDSLYTKLLSKQSTIAAAIYDKLRFRIVTRQKSDILPVLLYLSRRLFPFNYTIPGESINTILHLRTVFEADPHLRTLVPDMQGRPDDALIPGDNRFSGSNYRTIHFVVDIPVRIPPETLELAPPNARALGEIVYVLVEFQLIDQETEASNETGEASHDRYKERQKAAVMRRLKLGERPMRTPGTRRKA